MSVRTFNLFYRLSLFVSLFSLFGFHSTHTQSLYTYLPSHLLLLYCIIRFRSCLTLHRSYPCRPFANAACTNPSFSLYTHSMFARRANSSVTIWTNYPRHFLAPSFVYKTSDPCVSQYSCRINECVCLLWISYTIFHRLSRQKISLPFNSIFFMNEKLIHGEKFCGKDCLKIQLKFFLHNLYS